MTLLASTAGDAAYWGLALFLVAIGLASAFMLFRLGQAFQRLSSLISGTERDLLPVIVKTGGTVDRVNYELDKVGHGHRQRGLDGRQRRHGGACDLDSDRSARGEGLGPRGRGLARLFPVPQVEELRGCHVGGTGGSAQARGRPPRGLATCGSDDRWRPTVRPRSHRRRPSRSPTRGRVPRPCRSRHRRRCRRTSRPPPRHQDSGLRRGHSASGRRYDREMRTTAELREGFLSFFESKGHMRFPSWSLIPPPEDPSTLFISAGMQPLKPYFSGQKEPPAPRFTTVQKVLSAGGKDTDLDEVGLTARHASMFEMLGNFSFGDYFKDGAIDLAWEFVTEQMGLDPDRIWPTVFAGDPRARARRGRGGRSTAGCGRACRASGSSRFPRSENFWGPAGATGPCGPVLGAQLRPGRGARLRRAGLRARLRALRALPRVLEPRLHGVRPRTRTAR